MSEHISNESQPDDIKVILVGNSGVGKTSLINIVTGREFNEHEKTTQGSSFSEKNITINEKDYLLNIWDTIGQERYRQLTKIFYNNSKIVIFVYDITIKESFDDLKYWAKDVEEQIGNNIIKGVVANKLDLYLNEKVSSEQGKDYATLNRAKFIEFSAKTDSPSKFEEFLIELVKEYLPDKKDEKKIVLNKKNATKKKKCCK